MSSTVENKKNMMASQGIEKQWQKHTEFQRETQITEQNPSE